MELFVTTFDSFHSLTIARKISILDVADFLDPILIKDIFASQDWILTYLFKNLTVFWCFQSIERESIGNEWVNQFEDNFLFIQKLVNQSNDKEDGWLQWDGNNIDFKQLEKTAVHLIKC